MTADRMLTLIVRDNDQDIAAAKEWLRESSPEAVIEVWMQIQQEYDDPAMEIMSLFAQLGFALMYAEVLGEQGETT